MDEPLGALDKKLREQMQVEIKRIHRKLGVTIVYVTHDQSEALTMSDRVAVFRNGKVEQIASPLEVYRRPATRYVGEFVGDSNFFAGTVDPASPDQVELVGLGTVQVSPLPAALLASCRDVDLLLRPERLRLLSVGDAAPTNQFAMRVEAVINYGDCVLAIGKVADLPVRVRIAGAEPPRTSG